jgi:hypothetical protein
MIEIWSEMLLRARAWTDGVSATHLSDYQTPMTGMAKAQLLRSSAIGAFSLMAPDGIEIEPTHLEMGKIVLRTKGSDDRYQLKSVAALAFEMDASQQMEMFPRTSTLNVVLYRFDTATTLHLSCAPATIVQAQSGRSRTQLLRVPTVWGSWQSNGAAVEETAAVSSGSFDQGDRDDFGDLGDSDEITVNDGF